MRSDTSSCPVSIGVYDGFGVYDGSARRAVPLTDGGLALENDVAV
jgi:hypothetical protein